MTSARDAVHTALLALIESTTDLPVRVAPSSSMPYVRMDGDTEAEDRPAKGRTGSVVRPLVSVFSRSFGEARTVLSAIVGAVRADTLIVVGFDVVDIRLDFAASLPEPGTPIIYGERAQFSITVLPS